MSSYILITPARNEEEFIEQMIQSVIAQTVLPRRWVIISDGSTDHTDDIVEKYVQEYSFISLIRTGGDETRNFGSKAKAFSAGYETIKGLDYEFIGNLDADITIGPTYFEEIIDRFKSNSRLGLAGGVRFDLRGGEFYKVAQASDSVSGAVQFFRKECFDSIGGYQAIEFGGIDSVAEIKTRMQGWQVKNFPELMFHHHRTTGSSCGSPLKAKFRVGIQLYKIGYHPLFCFFRLFWRLLSYSPPIVGSIASLAGYLWAVIGKTPRVVDEEFVQFLRKEQMGKLTSGFPARKKSAFRITD